MRNAPGATQKPVISEPEYKEGQPCDFWWNLGGEYLHNCAIQEGFLTSAGLLTARGYKEIKAIRAEEQKRRDERAQRIEQMIQDGNAAAKAGSIKVSHTRTEPMQVPRIKRF